MTKVLIEVASAHGCSKCAQSREIVEHSVRGMSDVSVKEINIAENPDFAIKHRIMSTPSLIINGHLEFSSIPKPDELRKVVEQYKKGKR